jgi:HTH-type transcriptional regulator/antitoxin HigA
MDARPIRTEADYNAALTEIETLWDAPVGTPDGDKLDVLIALVVYYEDQHWQVECPDGFDPIEVIRHAIDEWGHTEAELADLLGSSLLATDVLSRKYALTVEMIYKISKAWAVPAGLLVEPYKIEPAA